MSNAHVNPVFQTILSCIERGDLSTLASTLDNCTRVLKAPNDLADKQSRKATRESGDFDSNVQGIPCQVVIDSCTVVKGSHSYNAPSALDYHGYSEVEFHLLDRKGYAAHWLEAKMSDYDRERIEEEILRHQRNQ